MNPGDIIENYQGRFAKVVEVRDSLFGLSAFVLLRDQAENETKADIFLNEYGLAQILKEGSKATEDAKSDEGEKPLSKLNHTELKAKATELGLVAEGTKAQLIVLIEAKATEDAKAAEAAKAE